MPIVHNAEITSVDIPTFMQALDERAKERMRFKIVGYKLIVRDISEIMKVRQCNLLGVPDGQS